MRLKSLELQGFKSFPDRTRLDFTNGFTAVVGPNGSGKSNISDAIRWVLGEQSSKTLRGSKMEDVIFLGTQTRRQQGFAQVALTFDNADRALGVDADEVTVARKYYRSGESEYLLNGKNVLLKDIAELLMDTGLSREGYSIIGQGRIDEIVSAKSADRRLIFEEAAGITKFRYRKKEAQKRLNLAEENLVRLTDILGELEARVGPLRAQAEKAKKFKELDAHKARLELSLWVLDLEQAVQRLRQQGDRLLVAQQHYDAEQQQLNALATRAQKAYDRMQQCQLDAERLRQQKEQLGQLAAQRETRIAVLQGEIAHAKQDILRIDKERETYALSGSQLHRQMEAKTQAIADLQDQIQQKTQEIQKTEQELLHFNEQGSGVSDHLHRLTESLNRWSLERSKTALNLGAFETRRQELAARLETVRANKASRQAEQGSAAEELEQVQLFLQEIAQKQQELENARSGYALKRGSRQQKLDELDAALQKLDKAVSERSQRVHILQELEQNMEGFSYSVKQVLGAAKQGRLPGVRGTVAQLVQLPEEYTAAIETALGAGMQNIVVEDEAAAKRGIRLLKESRAGRATFLPLTSVRGSRLHKPGLTSCLGFVGVASDLVSYDPAYENIFVNLLGRTVVAADLDSGVAIAQQYGYSFRIVTLDGQQINAGGSFTGGSRSKNAGLLSRKNEIGQLQQQAQELEQKRQAYLERREQLAAQLASIDARLTALDSERRTADEDAIRMKGEQKRLTDLVERSEETLAAFDREAADIEAKQRQLEQTAAQNKQAQQQAEEQIQTLEKQLAGLQTEQQQLREQRHQLEEAIHASDLTRSELSAQQRAAETALEDLTSRLSGNDDRLTALEDERANQWELIAAREREMDETREQGGADDETRRSLDKQIEQLVEQRAQAEKDSALVREEERQHQQAKEQFGQQVARMEEQKAALQKEHDGIITKMWESYSITVSEAQQRADRPDDPAECKRELAGVKSEIRNLGSVNLGAIEEYAEVSERYEFLRAQVGDARHSKNELEKMIRQLTVSMQDLFIKAFHEIDRNFQQIFVELFGGGHASLTLEDPADVLECGISIQVQPPGKIIKNLSALSGGEKAFVAIAIYFAILKVRPAPFCVLDEIEAALDDVNVNKFASYIKNIDDDTQFIVITHRRGTMEQADMLYGVTMQEEGVSKLLQLKVDEAAAMATA